MKKGGAKIRKKELSPQARFSWMPERFPSGLPLKAPWLVHGCKGGQESGYMAKGNRTTKNNLGLK